MHACIKLSGRQYTVAEGDTISVFRLPAGAGKKIEVVPLILFEGKDVIVDRERLAAAKVVCEITGEKKARKVFTYQKKHKTGYKKARGHRDSLTVVKIEKIAA